MVRNGEEVEINCKDIVKVCEALEQKRKLTPLQEITYQELLGRLKSYVDYESHRDDDPEYGQPLQPLVSIRRYFAELGMRAAAACEAAAAFLRGIFTYGDRAELVRLREIEARAKAWLPVPMRGGMDWKASEVAEAFRRILNGTPAATTLPEEGTAT